MAVTPKLTHVTGTNLCSKGEKISNATIYFQPRLTNGRPIGFRIGGGGQEGFELFEAEVNEGAFTIDLPDTSQTSPLNICYAVTVRDKASGRLLLGGPGSGYEQYQPSGDDDNFDDFVPNLAPQVSVQTGPPGEDGADGKSAYEIALDNGFEGDEETWLASLHGADGAQGPQGETGATGPAGPKGDKGDTGEAGTPATPNTASAPLVITDNDISIPKATASQAGYLDPADFTTFAGKQAAGLALLISNNLSDLADVTTARTNLGLGTAATQNTGTSGATVPLLNGANTWSAAQAFANISVTRATIQPTSGAAYATLSGLGDGYWYQYYEFNNGYAGGTASSRAWVLSQSVSDNSFVWRYWNGSSWVDGLFAVSSSGAISAKAGLTLVGNITAPNVRSIYTGSGSVTGSSLAPGTSEGVDITVTGAVVGAVVGITRADGQDTAESGEVVVSAYCTAANTVHIRRTRPSNFSTNFATSTRTYNVRVIN